VVVVVVVVVVLAVVAAAAIILVAVNRRQLAAQRALTSTAQEQVREQAAARAAEATTKAAELETAREERAAADDVAAQRAEQARLAEARAAAAAIEAESAAAAARSAEERAAAAEAAVASFRESVASEDAGVDPNVLWILEQARSERTWRFSVAPGPDSVSAFADASNPLVAALQVELDAAREDVGAVVELEADIPDGLTVAATVLTLRAAQELLADVVRRSEETTLRVHADGDDLIVAVDSLDENGQAVLPAPLPIPPSPSVDVSPTGVRIHNAIAPPTIADPSAG
jgi:hypothetical protein